MADSSLLLLNLFEVEVEGVTRHIVCFLHPEHAEDRGIDAQAILGEYTPGPDDTFVPETFQLNPAFVEALTRYMNNEAARAPEIVHEASSQRNDWLYIIDSRHPDTPDMDPPPGEVVGCFAVDDTGQIVPNSFQYNANHLWFDPTTGVSGLLSDRRFYDWLHSEAGSQP